MKRIYFTFIFVCSIFTMEMPAYSVTYRMDVLEEENPGGWTNSLKTFDKEYLMAPGQTIDIDIWVNDVPGAATAGGLWIDFTESKDTITYISAGRYNGEEFPGPWQQGGVIVNEPEGVGTFLIAVLQLGNAQPDSHGDLIIARITIKYLKAVNAQITISTIPDVTTWGPSPPWNDGEVLRATLSISPLSPGSTTSVFPFTTSSSSTAVTSSTTTTPSILTTSTALTTSTTPISSTSTTSSPTTIPIPPPCLVEKLYGEHSEEVRALKDLRDTVLCKTLEGREIIKVYYQWSQLLTEIIERDQSLRKYLHNIIDEILWLAVDTKGA